MIDEQDDDSESTAPAPAAPAPAPARTVPVIDLRVPPESPVATLRRAMREYKEEGDRLWKTDALTGEENLERSRRYLDMKAKLEALAAAAGDEPSLSADPQERALGLTAAEPPEPESIVERFEHRGETLTPEGKTLARGLATVLPTELHAEGETLMRDLAALASAPDRRAWTAEEAILELEPADVALYRIAWDRLPPAVRDRLTSQPVDPASVRRIAQTAERWLGTDAGVRWLTTEGGWKIRQDQERRAAADFQAAYKERYGE
jgi:hypothetical protein